MLSLLDSSSTVSFGGVSKAGFLYLVDLVTGEYSLAFTVAALSIIDYSAV